MKASEVAMALELLMDAGEPAHLEGEPGVGKTSIVQQVSKKVKRKLIYTRLSDKDPADARGMPIVDLKAQLTRWLTPAEFPQEGCGPVTWFIDEWTQGFPSVQNVFGQALNERRIGEYKVPDSVYICAASNRAKDRAATNKMPSHIADRFVRLTLEADVDDWTRWAFANNVETEVIAFIRWMRGSRLSNFDPSKDVSPTPRSWHKASNVLRTAKSSKLVLPQTVEERTYAGIVGDGAAAEFVGFLQVFRNMPDPTAILMNPDKYDVPKDPATLCAWANGLSAHATENNMDRVVKVANKMPDEFSTLLITMATAQNKKLASTRSYIQWASDHQHTLL